MLLLLPPSEGKTPAPDDAGPVDLTALAHPGLTAQRRTVLDALAAVSARDDATEVLGVSPNLAGEVARNVHLKDAPAGPAAGVYTGVLYGAAGLAALAGGAAERAARTVRIFSGLWGAVAPGDRIPAYRLSMGVSLPDVGPLAAAWKPALATELGPHAADDVVVDCRSATYAAAWKPATAGPGAAEWLTVRVVREVGGRRSVVSHNAKHTRGVLAGHLLRRAEEPTSATEVLAAARELEGRVILTEVTTGNTQTLVETTLTPPSRPSSPQTLELVLR
ncbi:YaaA family protein [Myceligenerans pegani]|uniref:Peroxide stress protein YaaA n=1 Tax=Myceligenerans pegani TaxID=2776917 RepID=A0ABR9MVJ0_9MICO|nr:peroxide stress protein YaaA [Myceligenerans sp. TRM 65318]MBE1875400.1 peroxide stress protein YaaA [Myceligenerans sp. TRM 65318]MBE3017671.1 peroxide stress protein YaaA [Myceligenerans sp. TRM 65318]